MAEKYGPIDARPETLRAQASALREFADRHEAAGLLKLAEAYRVTADAADRRAVLNAGLPVRDDSSATLEDASGFLGLESAPAATRSTG